MLEQRQPVLPRQQESWVVDLWFAPGLFSLLNPVGTALTNSANGARLSPYLCSLNGRTVSSCWSLQDRFLNSLLKLQSIAFWHRPTSTTSFIEQERFWVQPETLTTRQILIVEILSHNAKHQLFTHHELQEAIILSWNSELQVIGYRGVFNAGRF